MREAGLAGVSRRKGPRTTRRGPQARPAPDLVNRRFTADAPDRLWLADITYVPTAQGFLYLAIVLDAFSRRCREAGVLPSMGKAGDCFDSAMAESFFASLVVRTRCGTPISVLLECPSAGTLRSNGRRRRSERLLLHRRSTRTRRQGERPHRPGDRLRQSRPCSSRSRPGEPRIRCAGRGASWHPRPFQPVSASREPIKTGEAPDAIMIVAGVGVGALADAASRNPS